MDRLAQYLRRGLLIMLALVAFGGVTANAASASVAPASPALTQVTDGVTAQPSTDTPNKDQTTEDSLDKIATGVLIFLLVLAAIVVGAVAWAVVRRVRSAAAENKEDEPGEEDERNKPVV